MSLEGARMRVKKVLKNLKKLLTSHERCGKINKLSQESKALNSMYIER
jgi:hypothetical protein